MKKIYLITIISVLLCCSGCIIKNPYYGKRPLDYPNTKWVSDDPDIYFTVAEESIQNKPRMLGEIKANNETIPIQVSFNTNNSISVLYYYESGENKYTEVFAGKCKFEKEKCVVTDLVVNENANAYFSDNIKEIVFSREDLS